MTNLTNNAIKYNRSGGAVTVQLRETGDRRKVESEAGRGSTFRVLLPKRGVRVS